MCQFTSKSGPATYIIYSIKRDYLEANSGKMTDRILLIRSNESGNGFLLVHLMN